MISKLKKLRGRSIGELTDRGRQKLGSIAERVGLLRNDGMDDPAFVQMLDRQAEDAGEFLERFRTSKSRRFYPAFLDRDRTISELQRRFPSEKERILIEADKICSGHFDLLGYSGLDFGGPIPDWHLEPVSTNRTPLIHRSKISELDAAGSGDKKIVWELNRHQYLTLLGSAYWLTSDEHYARTALAHIEDWSDKNPPKMGINWASSLEVAYRSISWIWAIEFFLHSPEMTPSRFVKILKCLYTSAQHIEANLSTYSSPNTHLTGEALALYILGGWFPECDASKRWRETGTSILKTEITKQIRPDGGYVEQSSHYQRYTADIYLTFLLLARNVGDTIEPHLVERLHQLVRFMMHSALPDRNMPMIGDDDGGRLHFLDGRSPNDLRSTFALAAIVFDDPNFKFCAGEASPELLWLAGGDGTAAFDRLKAEPPTQLSQEFRESGSFSVRSGWEQDASFLYISCGPHGFMNGGHAHADALCFVLSVGGTPVFVDPGTYNYTSDPIARDRFRSTAFHNCLTVEGESSSVPAGPFSWKHTTNAKLLEWKSSSDGVLFRGEHDGFSRFGVQYTREIEFDGRTELVLRDRVKTEAMRSFEVNLMLSNEVYAVLEDGRAVSIMLKDGNRALLAIDTKLTTECESSGWSVEPAQISPRYGALVESTRLVFRLRSDKDVDIVTTMAIQPG